MSKVAKSGLKFVKKRVAGHKRSAEDIEDEAYERELAIQAAREGGLSSNVHPSHQLQTVLHPKHDDPENPQNAAESQVKKSSEDWDLFNKLIGKVETTVHNTVVSIEKSKEHSVVDEIIAKNKEEEVVIPDYPDPKKLAEAKKQKEEAEREALRRRREQDEWAAAFDATAKNQAPDLLLLGDEEDVPKLSFAYYSPSSGPSAIPRTPLEAEDPFDTSFVAPASGGQVDESDDPFDTSKIDERIEEVNIQTAKRMSFSSVNPFGGPEVQEDPNPRVRPPSRPTAGSSLFSSTECSPVDIPDDVQNFFKNASRRSSTNPFDPPELRGPVAPLSTEETIRTGAALLQAIASEFADKDAEDDDLFHRTLSSKGELPPPSPMSPFSEPETDQAVPEMMDVDSTASSAFKATEMPDPFADNRLVNTDPEEPVLAPTSATDAFQMAFGKKSIDLDDVPPSVATEYAPQDNLVSMASVKDTFDPFKGVGGLDIPSGNLPGPVSNAPTPGSDIFVSYDGTGPEKTELQQQEDELFGSKAAASPPQRPQAPPQRPPQPTPQRPPQPTYEVDSRRSIPNTDTWAAAPQKEEFAPAPQANVTSPIADTNPFSPKNSAHASPVTSPKENPFGGETVTRKSLPFSDDPFSSSGAAAVEKMRMSPDDSFAPSGRMGGNPEEVTSPPTENPFSRKASQDSNPFAPEGITSPKQVTVGLNNPFGDGPVTAPTQTTFSSAYVASSPFDAEPIAETCYTIPDSGRDPFDTSRILPPASDPSYGDDFASKFAQASNVNDASKNDPFGGSDIGGSDLSGGFGISGNFGGDIEMDYLNDGSIPMPQVPDNTPIKRANIPDPRDSFDDDDEGESLKITIRPTLRPLGNAAASGGIPTLAAPPKLMPPPKSPQRQMGYQVQPDRFNPFDKGSLKSAVATEDDLFSAFDDVLKDEAKTEELPPALGESGAKQAEPTSPSTPLFDEDTSQPLTEWRSKYDGDGWEFFLRWPNKKKFTGNRYWKPVYVKFNDSNILWVMNKKDDSDPIQEVPLQGCYSLSEMAHQPLDQYNKIFTIKLQYTFYKETVGVRKGQIAKVISGQVNSMGSVAKLGLPLQHAPQLTQLLKLGTSKLDTLRTFVRVIEETLFGLQIHRDRALNYKAEEIQATVVDEYMVESDRTGHVCSQKARVRLFFLAFVNGMPDVEVGINELSRQGKEIVGRYDIMPIVTEEWIRVENYEFHACVDPEEFEKTKVIKLRPPDATFFELMRFRVRPPRQRELPIQLTAVLKVNAPKVQLRADVLVPGYSSRKHGQIPCEDIAMYFPIPECWVYLFRVEKHFRYGALKSAARRPGKIKGLERIMGAAAGGNMEKQLIEVSAGVAKYEPAHKCIVWRVPRLPKEGQGAYTQQMMVVELELTSFDQIPDSFDTNLRVEFSMPASTVSHTTIRSISCPTEADLPVEKFCRYVAKHEYKVEMDVVMGSGPEAEAIPNRSVTRVEAKQPVPGPPPQMVRNPQQEGSDSEDSD